MAEAGKAARHALANAAFDRSPEVLAAHFHHWARVEAPPLGSPLYSELGYAISVDDEMLALAAHTRPGQPAPNNLFAAVHYLLLRGADHSLRRHYPFVSGSERPLAPAWPEFRDFCLLHGEEIAGLIAERRTQTNAIRRSAVLRPAFARIAAEEGRPLALIESGTSAGLNLLWDRFFIEYQDPGGTRTTCGPPDAEVRLHAQWQGSVPDVQSTIAVAARSGIDIHPIDIDDEDAMLWLHALIWPEHAERHVWLDGAVALARRERPRVVRADVLDVLAEEIDAAPGDAVPVVFATLMLYQLAPEARLDLLRLLAQAGQRRDLWMLSMEPDGGGGCEVVAVRFGGGERTVHKFADAHPHGWSLHWHDTDAARAASAACSFWQRPV